jgi:glycosyltransferase involved in cell wall biosynthesis
MKVLFLNPVGHVGGAERVLLDLLAALPAAEPSVRLHVAAPPGPLLAEAERRGAATTALELPAAVGAVGDSGLRGGGARAALALARRGPAAAWSAWRAAGRLRRVVERLRPDVVHSNGLKFHLLTRLARLRGPAVVWHLHDFVGSRPLMSRLLGWATGAAAGAVAVSRAVADDARRVAGRLPVAVVANAVDTDHFAPGPGDGDALDRLAGLAPAPQGAVRVGLVATFARWKGQDVFLRAAERAVRLLPGRPLRFYVVGGPIYRTQGSQWSEAELRELGNHLLAEGRLGFVPFQQDPAPVYRALDVVTHASTLPEPFGLTIAEAMACGRAVVVSRAGGAAELFTPARDAVGVPPGDADAMAAALASLADDPARRAALGEEARRTATARFRRDRMGHELLAAYRAFGVTTATPSPLPG